MMSKEQSNPLLSTSVINFQKKLASSKKNYPISLNELDFEVLHPKNSIGTT
jgi:hypothetical protein